MKLIYLISQVFWSGLFYFLVWRVRVIFLKWWIFIGFMDGGTGNPTLLPTHCRYGCGTKTDRCKRCPTKKSRRKIYVFWLETAQQTWEMSNCNLYTEILMTSFNKWKSMQLFESRFQILETSNFILQGYVKRKKRDFGLVFVHII